MIGYVADDTQDVEGRRTFEVRWEMKEEKREREVEKGERERVRESTSGNNCTSAV